MNFVNIVVGMLIGAFAGPLFASVIALIAWFFRSGKQEKKLNQIHAKHVSEVRDLKKRYNKTRMKYFKIREKVMKHIDGLEEDMNAEA